MMTNGMLDAVRTLEVGVRSIARAESMLRQCRRRQWPGRVRLMPCRLLVYTLSRVGDCL